MLIEGVVRAHAVEQPRVNHVRAALGDVLKNLLHESFAEEVRAQTRDASLSPVSHLDGVPVLVLEPRKELPAREERLVDDDDVVIPGRVSRDAAQTPHRY